MEEFRHKKHNVELTNQQIIEIGYITKAYLGGKPEKARFEVLNCWMNTTALVRELLKLVDEEYKEHHAKMCWFFNQSDE